MGANKRADYLNEMVAALEAFRVTADKIMRKYEGGGEKEARVRLAKVTLGIALGMFDSMGKKMPEIHKFVDEAKAEHDALANLMDKLQ